MIEDTVLLLRLNISFLTVEIQRLANSPALSDITPFHQALTTMAAGVYNITMRAQEAQKRAVIVDYMWNELGSQIDNFLNALNGSTKIKMNIMQNNAQIVFNAYNTSFFQYHQIHRYLFDSYQLLNYTVAARVAQQQVALDTLAGLRNETTRYLKMALDNYKDIDLKKSALIQKIHISIDTAKSASSLAQQTRIKLFALEQTLVPLYNRALQIQADSIRQNTIAKQFLHNATTALVYARTVLESVAIILPNYQKVRKFELTC